MSEPRFLTWEQVLEIHRAQLENFGGQDGLRDANALESALAQPEATFEGRVLHVFPFEMAAAYAFHISENQPFIDGNKRVALGCALIFLELNGISVEDSGMKLSAALMRLSAGQVSKKEFALLLESLAKTEGK